MGGYKELLHGSKKHNKKLCKTREESVGESQNCSPKERFQSLMQRFGILQCIAHDCQTHDCLRSNDHLRSNLLVLRAIKAADVRNILKGNKFKNEVFEEILLRHTTPKINQCSNSWKAWLTNFPIA